MKRVLLVATLIIAGLYVAGAPYYLLPVASRVRSALHPWFRSSGYVGQSLGILAFLFFVFLWLYPLRKRFRFLAFTGRVPAWLRVHVVAGLSIPFLVALHAGFRFSGLAGLAFAAMVIVWLSGIVGRYIYSHIPRSRGGLALTLQEIATQREDLVRRIAAATGLHPADVRRELAVEDMGYEGLGLRGAVRRMIADDFARRRALRAFRHHLTLPGGAAVPIEPRALREALRSARQEIALAHQVRLLDATHRVFRFWHVAHRPVAVTALVAVFVHVIVVITVGSTWFR